MVHPFVYNRNEVKVLPRFSVIVPTFDRADALRRCLDSLVRLDYPWDRFEVVVVDDGSPDPPAGVVAAFEERLDLVFLKQPNGGPGAARNLGIGRATGDYVAFTDDDCTASPGWLRALAARAGRKPGYAVGGQTVNAFSDNRYSRASQHLAEIVYGFYNSDPDRACFFASNNLAFPTEDLRRTGAFDGSFRCSEDRELCDRWLTLGRRLAYAPEAVIHHAHYLTFTGFFGQHFGYGRGAFHFYRARVRRGRSGMKLRPHRFYWRLIATTYQAAWRRRDAWLAPLILISQAASAAGFFREALGRMAEPISSPTARFDAPFSPEERTAPQRFAKRR